MVDSFPFIFCYRSLVLVLASLNLSIKYQMASHLFRSVAVFCVFVSFSTTRQASKKINVSFRSTNWKTFLMFNITSVQTFWNGVIFNRETLDFSYEGKKTHSRIFVYDNDLQIKVYLAAIIMSYFYTTTIKVMKYDAFLVCLLW